jgi:hypothetical protein
MVLLPAIDKKFLEEASLLQGISLSEFTRRIIADSRVKWITHNLWQPEPPQLKPEK